jgi:hypothetical protein
MVLFLHVDKLTLLLLTAPTENYFIHSSSHCAESYNHVISMRSRTGSHRLHAMRARVSLPRQLRTGLSGQRLSTGVQRRINAAAPKKQLPFSSQGRSRF